MAKIAGNSQLNRSSAFLQLASSIVGKVMAERGFEIERNRMDEEILQYVNLVGACERIYKTPNPHAFNVSFSTIQLIQPD